MKTKIEKLLATLAIALLASCAQMSPLEARDADIRKAAENARTYADHDRLAKQYENTAKELLVKAEEQKKLLQHYEEKSYLYGRQAQDHQSHTSALLNKYQQAAAETIKQAAFHHKMASELAKGDRAQLSNRESKAGIEADPEDWSGNSGKAL
jgi:predicted small lipoprotein YifL